MRSVNLLLAGLVAAAACAATPRTRPAPFRIRPDSVEPGELGGPFDGRVVDAETGRPISGAQVYATWTFVEGYGLTAPAATREHLTLTDANGRYVVPRIEAFPSGGDVRLSEFRLVIYKRGYVAYRSDRRFEDFGPRTDFAQKRNQVRLARWRSDISHVKHLRYVGGGPVLAELTRWEVPEAAAELSGRPSPQDRDRVVATGPTVPAPEAPPIDAKRYLKPEDVKAATGYKGDFDVGTLGDEPPSAEYDSVHLEARNQPEAYDVAVRVYRMDPAEAERHFQRIADELPNVKLGQELGDRSLRASSEGGDILGVAYLDRARGVVVLLQCGVSQCPDHDRAMEILRRVKERVDPDFSPQGGAR